MMANSYPSPLPLFGLDWMKLWPLFLASLPSFHDPELRGPLPTLPPQPAAAAAQLIAAQSPEQQRPYSCRTHFSVEGSLHSVTWLIGRLVEMGAGGAEAGWG